MPKDIARCDRIEWHMGCDPSIYCPSPVKGHILRMTGHWPFWYTSVAAKTFPSPLINFRTTDPLSDVGRLVYMTKQVNPISKLTKDAIRGISLRLITRCYQSSQYIVSRIGWHFEESVEWSCLSLAPALVFGYMSRMTPEAVSNSHLFKPATFTGIGAGRTMLQGSVTSTPTNIRSLWQMTHTMDSELVSLSSEPYNVFFSVFNYFNTIYIN